jgi:hypothetical protein
MAVTQWRITHASVLSTSSTYIDEGFFYFGSSTADSMMLLSNKVVFHDVLTPYLGTHNVTQDLQHKGVDKQKY